jgi:hypothetical protein
MDFFFCNARHGAFFCVFFFVFFVCFSRDFWGFFLGILLLYAIGIFRVFKGAWAGFTLL